MGMRAFFRRNIEAIGADPALRFYGAALAALHLLSFHNWRSPTIIKWITSHDFAVCWPFFERCIDHRYLGPDGMRVLLWVYLGLAVAGTLLFLLRRITAAYWILLLLNLVAVFVVAQDFRLRLNQHYMALIVSLVFLFLPGKRRLLQYQIVAFYFWAGVLKLNHEWLSGAALYRKPLGVPVGLLPEACAYVVLLETCLVFGVFARRAWIFYATLFQLILFHVTSWSVVGHFYPLLMFALLSIFPLARLLPSREPAPSLRRLLAGRESASTAILLSAFSFLQVIPWVFPGDSAITGEGRLFALHMFDARVVCEGRAVLHRTAGTIDVLPLRPRMAVRIRCDPIVYLNLGRAICREGCSPANPCRAIDIELRSRRRTEKALRPVMEIRDFCRRDIHYDLWRPNDWILK